MRRLLMMGAIASLLALGACSSDDDEGASTTTSPELAPVPTAATGGGDGPFIEDLSFGGLSVTAGEEVTVTNLDGFAHTFSIVDSDINVSLAGNATGTFTAPDAGTYEVFCAIHASMEGTLTVKLTAGAAPSRQRHRAGTATSHPSGTVARCLL